ncbi:hypothetical protein DFH09DRAFT_1072422 [Mycena vulgaris]|nr:hypothetical protein DFH09DRAFT_1072422 [Mycena vulgaris]
MAGWPRQNKGAAQAPLGKPKGKKKEKGGCAHGLRAMGLTLGLRHHWLGAAQSDHSWCLVAISGVWLSDWPPTTIPGANPHQNTQQQGQTGFRLDYHHHTTTFGARRHLWCSNRRKMVRLSVLRRRLTLAEISSRIPNYATQRELAVEHARKIVQHVRTGGLPESAINEEMEVKVGHTRSLPRWRKQYRKCVHPTDCTVWSVYYPARLRMKVERLVHLALRAKRAHPIIHACLGVKCHKRHREFYSLKAAGGWRAVEDEVVSALKATGQKGIERIELENDLVSHTPVYSAFNVLKIAKALQVKTQQWSSI